MSSKLAQFLYADRLKNASLLMNVMEVRQSADEIICLLFPQKGFLGHMDQAQTEAAVEALKKRFIHYFESVAILQTESPYDPSQVVDTFFNQIPELARTLDLDAEAALSGDPAAYSLEEVIITYPGFYAVCMHRLAHALFNLKIPLIPRLLSEYAHQKTGIDIHPGATISESFFIDHGTGVVIGETSHIGKNVKIYQGVTLGALSVKKKLQSVKRHPTIEDDVVIYANSTILGGQTIIGKGSIVGGNTWIIESVAPGSVITIPEKKDGN